MKNFFAFITYLTALMLSPQVAIAAPAADASACYGISDPDTRAYCLARAHRDAARCYSVQRPDLRAMCRAEAVR